MVGVIANLALWFALHTLFAQHVAVRAAGLRLDADALEWLLERVGADRGSTRGEVEKLILYAGPDRSIGLEAVRACVGDQAAVSFDDAVFAEADGAGWRLVVAIADVAHYVRPGVPLDLEARTRGNSVYFPDRVVPMLPELKAVLVDATRSKLTRARVVVTISGATPGRSHVLAKLKKLQVRHGLKERSFHALRHFFCSTLIRRGASIEAVRMLAGHSGLAVTQRYVHATGSELESAIAKLAGN